MLKPLTTIATVLALGAAALAHEASKGPNGGRVAEGGPYHVELVAKGARVEVYLTDAADKPLALTGFKGVAILLVGGKSQRIPLAPDGETRLSGSAGVALPIAPKGAVQIISPDGRTEQAQFK